MVQPAWEIAAAMTSETDGAAGIAASATPSYVLVPSVASCPSVAAELDAAPALAASAEMGLAWERQGRAERVGALGWGFGGRMSRVGILMIFGFGMGKGGVGGEGEGEGKESKHLGAWGIVPNGQLD